MLAILSIGSVADSLQVSPQKAQKKGAEGAESLCVLCAFIVRLLR